jgi:hypothetical protein
VRDAIVAIAVDCVRGDIGQPSGRVGAASQTADFRYVPVLPASLVIGASGRSSSW